MNSVAGAKALSWLPELYQESTVIQALLDALGTEVDLIDAATEELVDAATIATAPDWALTKYEMELAYPPTPTASDADRRARILAFSRRSSRTATIANIQELLSQFSNGIAVVTHDPPNYTVDIEFTDPGGTPPDLDFITVFMRRVIPAHLGITYTFNYYTWGELRSETITMAQLRSSGVTWEELGLTGPDIDGDNEKMIATKTLTFTGAANLGAIGNLPLMTVTGRVLIEAISIKCTTDLVSGGGGTVNFLVDEVGVTGPATTPTTVSGGAVTATIIDANEFHVKSGDIHLIMDSGGGGVYGTVAVGSITAGVIVVEVIFKRLSSTGNLVAV